MKKNIRLYILFYIGLSIITLVITKIILPSYIIGDEPMMDTMLGPMTITSMTLCAFLIINFPVAALLEWVVWFIELIKEVREARRS
jgi:tellurite resistance protein TehA-like permease